MPRLGRLDAVSVLLEAGADVARTDAHGAGALWHAAAGRLAPQDRAAGLRREASRKAVVKVLLEGGAEPGHSDRHGFAPIHAAAASGGEEAIDALLDAGADVAETDRNGRTPLIVAAQQGHAEAVARLLDRGADPRAVDRLGATAVTYARLAVARGAQREVLHHIREAGGRRGPGPREDTPILSVEEGGVSRIMRLDEAVAVYDSAGYEDHKARLLPYTTACRSHGCLVPPVAVLPAGTVVELIHREAAEQGRLHGVFIVQEPGLRGLMFEDFVYGAWPPAGEAVTEVSIGRVAHIRGMGWVDHFDVDLPAATGGLFW